MKIYALMLDRIESVEVFELFTSREQAEQAMEGLIGKQRKELRPYVAPSAGYMWHEFEFEIEEMTLR